MDCIAHLHRPGNKTQSSFTYTARLNPVPSSSFKCANTHGYLQNRKWSLALLPPTPPVLLKRRRDRTPGVAGRSDESSTLRSCITSESASRENNPCLPGNLAHHKIHEAFGKNHKYASVIAHPLNIRDDTPLLST
jgi:hypothetical protein